MFARGASRILRRSQLKSALPMVRSLACRAPAAVTNTRVMAHMSSSVRAMATTTEKADEESSESSDSSDSEGEVSDSDSDEEYDEDYDVEYDEEIEEEYVPLFDAQNRLYATGRRKTSVARVWLKEGSGLFEVNGTPVSEYFQPIQRAIATEPFSVTGTSCLFDIMCTVKGGGMSGQAGAIRLGVSRCLKLFDESLRTPLRKADMLTRDSRRVERKKPGQPKARKQDQWVKR